jgi:hypothetical protein
VRVGDLPNMHDAVPILSVLPTRGQGVHCFAIHYTYVEGKALHHRQALAPGVRWLLLAVAALHGVSGAGSSL